MTEWREFDPSVVVPEGLQDMLDAANQFVEGMHTILNAMKTALDIAAQFMSAVDDIQKALIENVYTLIDAVIQNLTQTGVYGTFHGPVSFTQWLPPSLWASDVAASFSDWFDANRPILPTPQFIGGIAIVGVSDTHNGLLDMHRKMFDMFNRFIASIDQLGRWPHRQDPWVVYPGIGRAPNWRSMRVADVVPVLGELADVLIAFKDMIEPTLSMKDVYGEFADLLQGKVNQLAAWSSRIVEILALIDTILGWEGAYYLPIEGEFDEDGIQAEFVQSTGGPMDIPGANYTSGMVFLGIGGTGQALLDMFRI